MNRRAKYRVEERILRLDHDDRRNDRGFYARTNSKPKGGLALVSAVATAGARLNDVGSLSLRKRLDRTSNVRYYHNRLASNLKRQADLDQA